MVVGGCGASRGEPRGGGVRPRTGRTVVGLGRPPAGVLLGDAGLHVRGHDAAPEPGWVQPGAHGGPGGLVPHPGRPAAGRAGDRRTRKAASARRGILGWLYLRLVSLLRWPGTAERHLA